MDSKYKALGVQRPPVTKTKSEWGAGARMTKFACGTAEVSLSSHSL